jgi:hypothetical protein
MIGFFIVLIVLMVLVAVCIPMFNGGGRRIYVDRRRPVVYDEVDVVDDVDDDVVLRPVARRRTVRCRGY